VNTFACDALAVRDCFGRQGQLFGGKKVLGQSVGEYLDPGFGRGTALVDNGEFRKRNTFVYPQIH